MFINILYLFALFLENSAIRYLGGEWFEGGRERRPRYRRNRARRPTTAARIATGSKALKARARSQMPSAPPRSRPWPPRNTVENLFFFLLPFFLPFFFFDTGENLKRSAL